MLKVVLTPDLMWSGIKILTPVNLGAMGSFYAGVIHYPLIAQRWSFLALGVGISLYFAALEFVSDRAAQKCKALIWLSLFVGFALSLETWVEEVSGLVKY